MLLKSSSTPVLGSLLSSIAADSPNNNNHYETSTPFKHHPLTSFIDNHNRLSFHPSPGSVHLSTTVSCGSSPKSPSVVDQLSDFNLKGFRRVHSAGNLEGLVHAACDSNEQLHNQNQPKKLSLRHKCSKLESIPSFSFYNSRARCEEEEDESFLEEEEEELKENEKLSDGSEEKVMAVSGSHEFNPISMENMLLKEEVKVTDKIWNVGLEYGRGLVGQEMFLAKGLGLTTDGGSRGGFRGGSGGGDEFNPSGSSGNGGGDNHEVEEYYKRMVEENPGNPLFLGNYAHFLYQSKRDLQGAEEYYSRAILADPKDGETVSQYAKLVWELYHDEERASSYFERAIQASPQDNLVHAAYASFLWETEEDGEEYAAPRGIDSIPAQFHEGSLARLKQL